MKQFYIIAHTHWDREWHKTYQENRVRLIRFMDDLFETIENETDMCFVLDGQTSLIKDYLEIKPYKKDVLKKYINQNRIIPGPWFVQPDEFLPSGESLIRNLLISKGISEEYGKAMNVGYLPDSFGQSASMPTILSGFGIHSALFYRGVADDDTIYNEFIWRGNDDSEILAVWMPIGYGNGMFLSEDIDKSVKEIKNNLELLDKRSISGNILLMSGSDQCFPKKFLPKVAKELDKYYEKDDYHFKITSVEEYMNHLISYKPEMQVLEGEFRKGKHSRAHISIGATRLDFKRSNYDIEQKYQSLLEPLNALVSFHDDEKNIDIINRGWRYIVENHAHDSICNVCTDMIHKEMQMRIEYADQIANYLIDENFTKLHSLINYKPQMGRPIIIFSGYIGYTEEMINVDVYSKTSAFKIIDNYGNEVYYNINSNEKINLKDLKVSLSPIPDDFYHKVNISFIAKGKGIGYRTYYLMEKEEKQEMKGSLVKNNVLENDYLKATVNENGSIYILDKINNKEYKNMNVYRDNGNAGDEYDYSPPYEDIEILSINQLKSVKTIVDTPIEAMIELKYKLEVPKTTSNEKRSEETTSLNITTFISLTEKSKHLDFKTIIDNNVLNHRVQVLFDFESKLNTNFADIQFGEIIRDNVYDLTEESENSNWSERYYPIYNQHKFSGLRDENEIGFIIMNKGLPQYEILDDATTKLGITLLSSVGYMGHENLKYRKGRRSGALCQTPDAQLKGIQIAEYSFLPINNTVNYHFLSHNYRNSLYAKSYPEFDVSGSWPDNLTIFETDELINSAFKCSEDSLGYCLRVYNPTRLNKENIKLKYNKHLFKELRNINLAEKEIIDDEVKFTKSNNLDMSDKAKLSGEIRYHKFKHNSVKTHKFLLK